jgi:hypothetical protein
MRRSRQRERDFYFSGLNGGFQFIGDDGYRTSHYHFFNKSEGRMYMKNFKRVVFLSGVVALTFSMAHAARRSLYDVPFNLDWKFAVGTQSGMEAKTFSDASWQTVSVPHSATYAAPVHSAEQSAIGATVSSDYCYRKKFYCPAAVRKMFIYFGAIMQTATVYVNGTSVGSHNHSGYTAFFFDISNTITSGDTNVVAIRCHAGPDGNIPPGGDGGQMPDFELFSGMCRDVSLICKDSVYVPLRGQRITTTGTTGSPTVHAVTTVRNEAAAAKSVMVTLTLLNSGGSSVATATGTASVAANGSSNFDLTTGAVSSPSLWSPSNPYLYSLRTVVTIGGATVDSVVEKVGLRFFSWSGSGNSTTFSVNGSVTELKGVCMAQFMGWILNAIPDSRYAKQVAMIKAMGINSIRCSHYPRSQAFYDACDSLGMLVLCEVPSWGCGGSFAGNTTFWNHMYACDTEMVLEGYNHPCIYGWSMFNEPTESLQSQFNNENTIIHALDPVSGSGRVTLIACIQGGTKYPFDILGLNYDETSSASSYCLNTEAYGNGGADCSTYGNWYRNYVRGNAMDADLSTSCSEANMEDNTMRTHYWVSGGNMAGGHFWCFMDYSSGRNTTGREGIVDRLWLPKNVYFKMRNTLMGTATDYWANGAPTQLVLTADNTSLRADGSDISLITATLRDASNACMHATCNVTFTASPASCVRCLYGGNSTSLTDSSNTGSVTVAAEGGRAGVLLRTSRTAGTITVSATATCVSSTPSVTLTSTAPPAETIGPFKWSTSAQRNVYLKVPVEAPRLKIAYTAKGVLISFPAGVSKTVHIIDCQGKEQASYLLKGGATALVDRRSAVSGIVFAVWDDNGRRVLARLNIVR